MSTLLKIKLQDGCSHKSSSPGRMLSCTGIFTSHNLGKLLSYVHLCAILVSYYALFTVNGWLLLGKPPGCLRTLPHLSLTGHIGTLVIGVVFPSVMKLIFHCFMPSLDLCYFRSC